MDNVQRGKVLKIKENEYITTDFWNVHIDLVTNDINQAFLNKGSIKSIQDINSNQVKPNVVLTGNFTESSANKNIATIEELAKDENLVVLDVIKANGQVFIPKEIEYVTYALNNGQEVRVNNFDTERFTNMLASYFNMDSHIKIDDIYINTENITYMTINKNN